MYLPEKKTIVITPSSYHCSRTHHVTHENNSKKKKIMASHVAISRENPTGGCQSKMVPSSKEGSKNLSSLHAILDTCAYTSSAQMKNCKIFLKSTGRYSNTTTMCE
jgi:hypothetical protein